MRRAPLILVVYLLTLCLAGFALSRALPGSRAGVNASLLPAVVPVGMLAVMITLWGRSRGWIFAVAGLLLSMLVAESLIRPVTGLTGTLDVVLAIVMLMIALLRSGGWQAVRRHPRLAAAVAGCAGLLVVVTLAAAAIYVATYYQPHCVDTCVGPLIVVILAVGIVVAVIVLLTLGAAFAKSWVTGLGALSMFLAQIAIRADTSHWPTFNLRWAFLVAVWYAALFAVVSPWTWPAQPATATRLRSARAR
jgi:hypothetical protein